MTLLVVEVVPQHNLQPRKDVAPLFFCYGGDVTTTVAARGLFVIMTHKVVG